MDTPRFPAPWQLQGEGYILLYRFKRDFVEREGRVPAFLRGCFRGGLGSVMLVNYASSDAGPYGECLFIPGKFRFRGKRLNSITKIYVSTQESVVNGRANWGIPKEQADFSFEPAGDGTECVRVTLPEGQALCMSLKSFGPAFPVSTRLLPFPLVQEHEGSLFYTNFFGKGKGRLARVLNVETDPALFPDLSSVKPLALVRVAPFSITFPVAESEPADK